MSFAIASVLSWGCGVDAPDEAATEDAAGLAQDYVEVGDIEQLRAHGRLRFANVARANLEELPRLRWGAPSEGNLAQEFADRQGLELVIEDYPSEAAAQAALLEGRVDGIVGRSGPGIDPPPDGIVYSAPFSSMVGVFVSRLGEAPDSLPDLDGHTVTLASSSPFLGVADTLASARPDATIDTVEVPSLMDAVDMVLDGRIDLTLAERWVAEAVAAVQPELEIGMEFAEIQYTAALRASNSDLLRLVNDFAFDVHAAGEGGSEALGDLEEIRARRVLRVLTVNGPSSYYVYKGALVGFDLDMVRLFADEQNLIVRMVVAPSVEQLEPWLTRGLGDMIGAGIVPPAIQDTTAVRVTREYHDVYPVVIARRELGLSSLQGIAGFTALAGRNNPYLPLIEQVADSADVALTVTTDAESSAQLLDRLEGGEADMAVLESHLVAAEIANHPGLAIVDSVPEAAGRAWAVRADQPQLLSELDAFLAREVGGTTHAVLLQKYFVPEVRRVEQPDLREDGSLSPWDEAMRVHAEDVGLDWRLLTAQMFQESRFNPRARSPIGAYGLMQLMPATARQMGVRDIEDPEEQIRAGVGYMSWLYGRFSPELALGDRIAFTLAAYNAGYGHVSDARRVAELTGRNPDRWFESVELAMLSLSDPDVYRFTRHGYVRGAEPVRYVRRINELGQMYYRLAPN